MPIRRVTPINDIAVMHNVCTSSNTIFSSTCDAKTGADTRIVLKYLVSLSVAVDGVCYGHGSASYTIGYNVGRCPGYDVTDCFTGLGSTMHVIVEEVYLDSHVTCPTPFSCP